MALVHTSDSSKMQRRKMGGHMLALHFVSYADLQMKFVDVVQ